MFYHQVSENALDHFLQALFAVNDTYFPSRKRSEQYIKAFKNKPNDCYERICNIIKNSVSSQTIEESINELRSITKELIQIGNTVFKRDLE